MIIAQQIGRYHLLDRIAVGGMAEIFRAITYDSQGFEHMVAIKRVLRHLADDDDFLQMLVDEAKINILLDHENIAKVFEFARVEDDYFIAMEYVDGKDLRSILDRVRARGSKLAPEHCAYIIMKILTALHETHDKCDGAGTFLKIVHRDVSPSNLLVSYTGAIKLCDFGIAKATLSRIQTRAGVIKGKVKYMSPEQAMGRLLDRRSDIFSAGSVLYEMLTQRPPFSAENEMDLIFKVRDARYKKPSRLNPDIPPELERIVRKALSRSLASRYQTAAEFAAALQLFLDQTVPDYDAGRLGRLVCDFFDEEIEKDLRMLEEFVVGNVDPDAVGDNLLAEVLGEGAAYTRFTPQHPDMPTPGHTPPSPGQRPSTRLIPRVPIPEARLPEEVDLHAMGTQILDMDDREQRRRIRKRRPRPGLNYTQQQARETQQVTVEVYQEEGTPTDPRNRLQEDEDHPDFHKLPTKIIRVEEEE